MGAKATVANSYVHVRVLTRIFHSTQGGFCCLFDEATASGQLFLGFFLVASGHLSWLPAVPATSR